MGYNVNTTAVNLTIPADKLDDAVKALKELNQRDDLKTGGASGPITDGDGKVIGYGRIDIWFAWMDPQYDQKLHTVPDIMDAVGFKESEIQPDGTFELGWYDNKTGAEEHFLRALAPFVDEGSYVAFEGEDGTHWRYFFEDGEMRNQTGSITYSDD
ncbi:hypothetical protein WILDE_70 [Arthrobacter phage Wilde]|uniref:Uncharacterized protein n=1 Tax=Arthrobacter phage Wilde TaxID=1772323 RepID=A0A0U4JFB2_9CAUD|nr:hypothetical protein WILDE_70 [Arthrobacter phage Wilde]